MSKPYHHGDLRSSLLAASEAILDREGIDQLTLRGAAREAGVSHAAPGHHFGDLSGLLSALAATGFVRLRERLEAHLATAGEGRPARVAALGRGYVAFARDSPGLFRLMFRSERLDWSAPVLAAAGEAAFAMLTQDDDQAGERDVLVLARWSLVHGLATLLLDGRLDKLATTEAALEALVAAVIDRTATV